MEYLRWTSVMAVSSPTRPYTTSTRLHSHTLDDHLTRFETLANRTAPLNHYISTSIALMILQVRGIIYFKNKTWQECLTVLDDATQRESRLVPDVNSPILVFARSSELLAMHLLLIHRESAVDTVSNKRSPLQGCRGNLELFFLSLREK
jgi:hypothetical protein